MTYNFTVLDKIHGFKPFIYENIKGYSQISIDAEEILNQYPVILQSVDPQPKDPSINIPRIYSYKLVPILLKAIQELNNKPYVININDENYAVNENDDVITVYADTANRTIIMPDNPQQSDKYTIIQENGSSYNVIVDGNGYKLRSKNGNVDTYTMSENESLTLIGISGNGNPGWYVI